MSRMYKRFALVGLLAVGLVAGCGEDGSNTGQALDAAVDAGDAGDIRSADVGADAPADTSADTAVEADAAPDTSQPSLPPRVAGPPPELYDCTADSVVEQRRSPVPLSCVLDASCTEPMVVAHRGAGGQFGIIAPENSLGAIRAALVMGVDGIEVDVRHTADDQLVLMHDASVNRTTEGEGTVSEMTAAQVTSLHLLRPPNATAEAGDFSCETVPTLAEALALTKGRLFVDLDTKTDRVDLVVQAIKDAGVVDQVFISVSDPARAEQARNLDDTIRIQVRPDTEAQLDQVMEQFDRSAEIIEIPDTRISAWTERIHGADAKVFADVFERDAKAYIQSTNQPYLDAYDDGADILQTEFAPLVLQALDRWQF